MLIYLKAFIFCLLCTIHINALQAQEEDNRFRINVQFETSAIPPLSDQVKQALPTLWQRIVSQDALATLPSSNAMTLLQGVHPQTAGSIIEFNSARVWAYLEENHIPHIRTQPRFNLHIKLTNAFGSNMQRSANELLTYANNQANVLGIQLNNHAPLLAIHIQWLDDQQVQLSVRGQSRLHEFSETKSLDLDEPFVQLQQWIVQTLIQARDAYTWQQASSLTNEAQHTQENWQTKLMIEQHASLSEQVSLEAALQQDPRIQSIVPSYLNHLRREYIVQLKSADESWIADWFEQRGMSATPNPNGWLIQ